MLAAQDGKCNICRSGLRGKAKYFDIDHDHSTGRIRGLVCRNCNAKLGWLETYSEAIARHLGG